MKRRFFDTGFAKIAGLPSQMPRVLRYAVENRNSILSVEEVTALAMTTRNHLLRTPLAEFFERIIGSEGLNSFAAIYVPEKGSSVPEALTVNSVTLDLAHLPDGSTAPSIPELRNKVLINVTGIVKADRQYGGYIVGATDIFQNTIARGLLTASYQDTDGWLSPYLAEFAVKSYSMILSGMISRYHDLTLNETLKIAGVLALYMCQGLSREDDDRVHPPLYNRCTWIGNRMELESISKFCAEESVHGLTLPAVAKLIGMIGPSRISQFTLNDFVAIGGTLGPDLLTSQLALEFPPYWIYMLLLSLSGQKIPLVFQLNNQKLASEGRTRFLSQLLVNDALFKLNRRQ